MSTLIQAAQYVRDNDKKCTIEVTGDDIYYSGVEVTAVDESAITIKRGRFITVIAVQHIVSFTLEADEE